MKFKLFCIICFLQIQVFGMQIFVRLEGGRIITLEVEPADQVETIKLLIQDRENISSSNQILSFGGTVLQNSSTLADYNIQKESTLDLAIDLPHTKIGGQGVRVMNFTLSERNALASPEVGQMIYQTDNTAGYYLWDGDSWEPLSTPITGDYLPISGGTLTGTLTCTTGSFTTLSSNQVAIGTSSPNTSAALEISSTSQGLLLPSMTTTERDAITTPEKGLMIYNTSTGKFQGYKNSTSTSDFLISNETRTNITITGTSFFQTFIAPSSSKLNSMKILYSSSDILNFTVKVYEGAGNTGTLLGTITGFQSSGSVGYSTLDLSSANITLSNGSTYSIGIVPVGGFVSIRAGSNVYTNGSMFAVLPNNSVTTLPNNDLNLTLGLSSSSDAWVDLH